MQNKEAVQSPETNQNKDHPQSQAGLLAIHLAVLLFGLSGVIGKSLDLPAVIITFARVLISAIFLFLILISKKEPVRIRSLRNFSPFLAAGLIMAIHWTTFLQSIRTSTVAIGTLTFSTFPLFVTFLEPYFFREKLKAGAVLEALGMLLGVFILVPEFEIGNRMTQGILWGMAGSISYAFRRLAEKYSGEQISFYEQFVATILLLPSLWLIPFKLSGKDMAGLLILGIVCTGIGQALFITGLKNVRVQTAGIISGLESVYGIIFAFLFLGEAPGIREICGGLIILGISTCATLTSARKNAPDR
ncbi:MAG: EamA-like transporter family protein [Chloroflexi bacterium ADurb.Bin344]|nr:MAG: EamA-like transporter family protein [Chloroflexi bacterium ADurb.Bin344]